MAITLKEIQAPVAAELSEFEQRFRDNLRSRVPLLDRITHYIVKRKGKRLRPLFIFLTARLNGGITERTYLGASLIELLHTATLVHDDVVDDAYQRRGFFSINALWKNKIAVLVGDYLLSKGLLLALNNDAFQDLKIVSRAVEMMSEGELLQIEKARRLDIDEAVYYDIIRQKTASLIASACAIGALSAGADEAEVERMRIFGEKVGICFQIKDDLLDYGTDRIGKPRAIDIKEKKMTLPLIYTLNHLPRTEKNKLIKIVKRNNTDRGKVSYLMQKVKETGGLEYAGQAMYRYRDEALEIIQGAKPEEVRIALEKLIRFTTERKY